MTADNNIINEKSPTPDVSQCTFVNEMEAKYRDNSCILKRDLRP